MSDSKPAGAGINTTDGSELNTQLLGKTAFGAYLENSGALTNLFFKNEPILYRYTMKYLVSDKPPSVLLLYSLLTLFFRYILFRVNNKLLFDLHLTHVYTEGSF